MREVLTEAIALSAFPIGWGWGFEHRNACSASIALAVNQFHLIDQMFRLPWLAHSRCR